MAMHVCSLMNHVRGHLFPERDGRWGGRRTRFAFVHTLRRYHPDSPNENGARPTAIAGARRAQSSAISSTLSQLKPPPKPRGIMVDISGSMLLQSEDHDSDSDAWSYRRTTRVLQRASC